MKAYHVSEDCEGSGVIRFAKHAVVARREGADELDMEFEGVDCRRAPEFDQYAPGPVPLEAQMDHGWWIGCTNCQRTLYIEDGPVIVGQNAYCSPWCRLNFFERYAKDMADARLAEHLAKGKFPGAIDLYGYRTHDRDNVRKYVLQARFKFPGCQYPAKWQVEGELCWIHPDDSKAFNAWKASGYA